MSRLVLANAFAASDAATWERILAVAQAPILGVATWRVVAAALVVLFGFLVQGFAVRRLLKPLHDVLETTDVEYDEALVERTHRPVGWLVELVAIYVAIVFLGFPDPVDRAIDLATQTAATLLVAWALFRAVAVLTDHMAAYTRETETALDDQLVPVVRRILRFAIVVVGILLVVQQWGYNVTSLIAGLGIGGLAFALAARQTLSNWFGALMIFTDRPFEIGDWVVTDHTEGTVEQVGLRSTRIREYGDSLVHVPNSEMASVAIENSSNRERRRIATDIGLDRDTSRDQIAEIVDGIESLFAEHDGVADDDYRAHFAGFEESALRVELNCFTTTPELPAKRDIREELYLEILGVVEEAGTSLAYPTRTVQLEEEPDA